MMRNEADQRRRLYVCKGILTQQQKAKRDNTPSLLTHVPPSMPSSSLLCITPWLDLVGNAFDSKRRHGDRPVSSVHRRTGTSQTIMKRDVNATANMWRSRKVRSFRSNFLIVVWMLSRWHRHNLLQEDHLQPLVSLLSQTSELVLAGACS